MNWISNESLVMFNEAALVILAISSLLAVIFAPKELRMAVFVGITTIIVLFTVIYFFSYIALPFVSFVTLCVAVHMIRLRIYL